MMRTMTVWIGAALMVGGLWSASLISQGVADEPAAPSSASGVTGGAAAGTKTGGSETVPPVVEGQPAPPPEADEVQERAITPIIRDHRTTPGIFTPSLTTPPQPVQPAPQVCSAVTGPVPGALGPAKEQSFPGFQYFPRILTGDQGWTLAKHIRLLADVDGDGRKDLVGFGDDGVWFAYSHGTTFDPLKKVVDNFGYNQGWRVADHVRLMADVNGDRRQDIVAFGNDGVWLALSTGTGFAAPTLVVQNFGYNQFWRNEKHVRLMADVNGDGCQDIVAFGDAGVWTALSTGTGFAAPTFVLADLGYNQTWRVQDHPRLMADVNGDGRQDIVAFSAAGVLVALSTGTGFAAPTLVVKDFGYNQGWRGANHLRLMADVNGDGRQDIVAFGDAGVWTALLTVKGFAAPTFVLAKFGYNDGWRVDQDPRFVGDLNNDGYPDIVGWFHQGVYRSLGGPQGFREIRLVHSGSRGMSNYIYDPVLLGDVDGNGMQDLVQFSAFDLYVYHSSNSPPSQSLTISQVVDPTTGFATPITPADIDSILADAGTLLQTKDSANDVACPVGFKRLGNIERVVGPVDIDTQEELDQVFNLPGYVKVVRSLDYCRGFSVNTLGCTRRGQPNSVVERPLYKEAEGRLWAHEYGHTKGLPDRTDSPTYIMYQSVALGTNNREVDANECAAYQVGPVF